MRGSQVGVFLLPEDTEALEAALRSRVPFLAASGFDGVGDWLEVSSLAVERMGQTPLCVYLIPGQFARRRALYSAARSAGLVDPSVVPVVEFDRCYHEGTLLRQGRLYGVASPDALDAAGESDRSYYRQWVRTVMQTARRCLVRRQDGMYVGRHALAAAEHGLRLVYAWQD